MSLENQKLACVQAFLEDRASERLMTRLLAEAGEDYAWFRRLAQHIERKLRVKYIFIHIFHK